MTVFLDQLRGRLEAYERARKTQTKVTVINGELLYTRYLEDISHLTTALLEAEERYDLYYPGQKMPADIPAYLPGRGPLSREIVLKPFTPAELSRTIKSAMEKP